MMKTRLIFGIVLLSTNASDAQEIFGSFVDYPQGEFILQEPRPVFRLTKDFTFHDEAGVEWTAPANESVDGASIPIPAWSFIGGPFEGRYLYAAIVHDYFSCSKSRDFNETQDIFWRAMRATGVEPFKAWYMWFAVRFLGPPRWHVDAAALVPAPCRSPDAETATIFDDLDEDDKLKAISKLAAVQRTLETSRAQVLDVVDGEIVEVGTERAARHVDELQTAVITGFRNRDALGLFAVPSEAEVADPSLIDPWAKGDVVELDEYLQKYGLPQEYGTEHQERIEFMDFDLIMPRLELLQIDKIYEVR